MFGFKACTHSGKESSLLDPFIRSPNQGLSRASYRLAGKLSAGIQRCDESQPSAPLSSSHSSSEAKPYDSHSKWGCPEGSASWVLSRVLLCWLEVWTGFFEDAKHELWSPADQVRREREGYKQRTYPACTVPMWWVWVPRKGSKGWIRRGRVSASQGSEEVAENQSLQCHSKSSRKPWWRLRRGGNVIPLCALCSSHWEMYDNEPDKLWARAVRKRVELSCQ